MFMQWSYGFLSISSTGFVKCRGNTQDEYLTYLFFRGYVAYALLFSVLYGGKNH